VTEEAAVTTTDAQRTQQLKKITAASVIGTALEWYDYYIYGLAAALVFKTVFFPGLGTVGGTLAAFATFAVGFLARPLGGIVFGALGDRVGRKRVLVITLLLMGTATTLIGVIPDAGAIGWLAPLLLVVLRLIQGFGAGAEFGGAVLMCAETAPKQRRGFFSSLPQIGVALGGLASTGVWALTSSLMSKQEFVAYGWRIPFLLSIVAVLIGLYIRLRVVETPVFEKLKAEGGRSDKPVRDVFRTHPRNMLVAMGTRFADNGVAYVYQTFVLAYAIDYLHNNTDQNLLVVGIGIASGLSLFSVPGWGALSDRIGRRTVYLIGAVFSLLFVFPFFGIISLDGVPSWLVIVAIVLALSIGKDMMSAAQAAYFAELFDARVRYTGFATARELTSIIGGVIPLVAAWLVGMAGGSYWPAATLLCALIAITIVALLFGPETKDRDMDVDLFSDPRAAATKLPVPLPASGDLASSNATSDDPKVPS
jgi:MHS family shikimate/dehydroshikimate transporter-like MFS transporter